MHTHGRTSKQNRRAAADARQAQGEDCGVCAELGRRE